jgi:hypothetical protein
MWCILRLYVSTSLQPPMGQRGYTMMLIRTSSRGELRRAANVAHSVARPHVQHYLPRVLMVVARRAHRLAYTGSAVKRGDGPGVSRGRETTPVSQQGIGLQSLLSVLGRGKLQAAAAPKLRPTGDLWA